jgi:hypothetical protein
VSGTAGLERRAWKAAVQSIELVVCKACWTHYRARGDLFDYEKHFYGANHERPMMGYISTIVR